MWVNTSKAIALVLENISAKDLALHLGVSLTFVKMLESGKKSLPPRFIPQLIKFGVTRATFVNAHVKDCKNIYYQESL